MHQVDFLGRYIPEFGQLTCLVQHEFFHRYTADEHTLVCIEKLDSRHRYRRSRNSRNTASSSKSSENPGILYLALLLARYRQGRQRAAPCGGQRPLRAKSRRAACNSRPSSARRSSSSSITTSSSRASRSGGISMTPRPSRSSPALMKTQANLDALMLLTLADGQGTGDQNWSDWKETLVWHLHHNTSLYLADGEAFYRARARSSAKACTPWSPAKWRPITTTRSTRISSTCRIVISRPTPSRPSSSTSGSSAPFSRRAKTTDAARAGHQMGAAAQQGPHASFGFAAGTARNCSPASPARSPSRN